MKMKEVPAATWSGSPATTRAKMVLFLAKLLCWEQQPVIDLSLRFLTKKQQLIVVRCKVDMTSNHPWTIEAEI